MKRIKNLTLGILGATVLSLGLFACSNDDAETTNATTEQKVIAARESVNSDIKPEYFEFMGKFHNDGLDYIYDNSVKYNYNLQYDDLKLSSLEYFDYKYEYAEKSATLYFTEEMDYNIKNMVKNNLTLNQVVDELPVTDIEKVYLYELEDIVMDNIDYKKKIDDIDRLNVRIQNNPDLDDVQLARLFMTNSVAKHSIQYWNSEKREKWEKTFPIEIDPNYDGAQYQTKGLTQGQWNEVIRDDIKGFIGAFGVGVRTGAIRGAIVIGLASGGTGALAGAIIGALGGGVATGAAGAALASGASYAAITLWPY